MAFGRICLIGDAAFAVRPHAAAGTAKAAADGWAWPRSSRRRAGTSRPPSRPGSGGNSPSVMTCWPAAAPSVTAPSSLARSAPVTRASIFGLYGPGN